MIRYREFEISNVLSKNLHDRAYIIEIKPLWKTQSTFILIITEVIFWFDIENHGKKKHVKVKSFFEREYTFDSVFLRFENFVRSWIGFQGLVPIQREDWEEVFQRSVSLVEEVSCSP